MRPIKDPLASRVDRPSNLLRHTPAVAVQAIPLISIGRRIALQAVERQGFGIGAKARRCYMFLVLSSISGVSICWLMGWKKSRSSRTNT